MAEKERYIVLRRNSPLGRDPDMVAIANSPEDRSAFRAEAQDFSAREAADVRRDPDTVVLARSIPICLIQPMAGPKAPVEEPGEVSWGVEAVGARECAYTGAGVTVALLDTGITSHVAFPGDVEIVPQNFTDDPGEDVNGHGTHCAGTLFGREVNGVRIGVAPGIRRALIAKVLGKDGGDSDALARAIIWAVGERAHIISMSLAMDFPRYRERLAGDGMPPELATSRALQGFLENMRLFDRLAHYLGAQDDMGRGALLIAAAGNESRRELHPSFRLGAAAPAAAEGFVAVAAVGRTGIAERPLAMAHFSNMGGAVAAPGKDIWSAKRGGGLLPLSGTSMATPHVAGVAALWAEKLMKDDLRRGKPPRFVAGRVLEELKRAAVSAEGLEREDVGAGLVRAP